MCSRFAVFPIAKVNCILGALMVSFLPFSSDRVGG